MVKKHHIKVYLNWFDLSRLTFLLLIQVTKPLNVHKLLTFTLTRLMKEAFIENN